MSCGSYTFLPELYDIFGREATIKFLDVFAGCKLRVPRLEKLEVLARDTSIYMRIENVSDRQKPAVIKSLAEEYESSEDRIRSYYASTKVKLEQEYGFKVRRVKRAKG